MYMENSTALERGTHNELMAREGSGGYVEFAGTGVLVNTGGEDYTSYVHSM